MVLSGVCHRYPELKFVSVENGAGWLPFLGEAMDWQWLNVGAHKEYPERLLPSEYLRRQIFGMYWFEKESLRSVIDLLADNLMFETDFPHATSLLPARHQPLPRPGVGVAEPAGGHGAVARGVARGHHRQGPPAHRDQALPPGTARQDSLGRFG